MNNNNIYTPPMIGTYVENPFDRQDPANPQIDRPHLPNDVVLNILKYLPPSEAHEFMTLTKSEMGVNRIEHHQNLLFCYKTSLTTKDLLQYQKIFSIGSPQLKSLSEIFSDLTFPNVTQLDLSNNAKLTDADLITILHACPNLTSLNLDMCRGITDASILELVNNNKKLTSINLRCTKITDVSLKALAEHPNLTAINLELTKTSIEEVKSFAKSHPNLTEIHLTKKELSDENVRELSLSCPLLESITLNYSSFVGDIGIQALAQNCPNLRSIRLLNPNRLELPRVIFAGITDEGLNALAMHSKKLTSINLAYCKKVTPAGIENLLKNCPITSLALKECYQTNNERIKSMAPLCTNLTSIDLTHEEATETRFTGVPDSIANYLKDDGLTELAKYAKNLRSIDLSHKNRITINGIKELAKNCPNLVSVNLFYCNQISDQKFKELITDYPNIRFETKQVQS